MTSNYVGLIWLDPGDTTGIFRCRVSKDWLKGKGAPDWDCMDGLGGAVRRPVFVQIGKLARAHASGRAAGPRWEWRTTDLAPVVGGPVAPYQADEIQQAGYIAATLRAFPTYAWGHEDFIPRSMNQSRSFLSPVRLFSSLTALEVLYGNQRMPFIQSAALAKQTATDARMKQAELYLPGLPHAMDAARHAMTFIRRARTEFKIRNAAWPDEDWS